MLIPLAIRCHHCQALNSDAPGLNQNVCPFCSSLALMAVFAAFVEDWPKSPDIPYLRWTRPHDVAVRASNHLSHTGCRVEILNQLWRSKGQRSRSNVTKIQTLLGCATTRSHTKLSWHHFLIRTFSVVVPTDRYRECHIGLSWLTSRRSSVAKRSSVKSRATLVMKANRLSECLGEILNSNKIHVGSWGFCCVQRK